MSSFKVSKHFCTGAVQVGHSVWLKCDFDLEGDDLYSVKWYKNHVEFYRYQPRDRPPGQTYRLSGTFVDLDKSNSSHVFLNSTDLNSEGLYGCEVSGEAPSFSTAKSEDEMRVYALPSGGPDIIGLQSRYQVGDEVNITCSFGPSKPAAKVNWYINGELAQAHHVTHLPPKKTKDGLQWIELRLVFTMSGTYIRKGGLRLQCLAEVYLTYARAHHELVIGERLSGPGPQNEPNVIPSRRRPRVSGSSSRYDVGDLVDINCTSAKETTPPILRWFINDREVPRRQLVNYGSIRSQSSSLFSSVLGLRFHVQQHHLRQGELRLRCESTLAREILRRREEVIFEGRHETAELQVSQIANSVKSGGKKTLLGMQEIAAILITTYFLRRMLFVSNAT
ncbi:uncharacterized protein LOC129218844 [Uloborus diversus]|uniref:uncharacterized protein LOC129218844 n=1 Tax=Uloborus diversus TaxID=327109 RepID=UPI00240A13B2|nr:uncharacterized protein LOC129218844 [Uloborus diversus]